MAKNNSCIYNIISYYQNGSLFLSAFSCKAGNISGCRPPSVAAVVVVRKRTRGSLTDAHFGFEKSVLILFL